MKQAKLILITFMFILCTIFSYADGTCVLNKFDFHPGENAIFTCDCTSPIEENQPGYFVWQNSNGTIIRSESTNSGLCRGSSFGDQFIFPFGETNYTGNVTFSLNADGTGDPLNWVGDITSDDFNVTGAHSVDCVIEPFFINESLAAVPVVRLGLFGSIQIQVRDAITQLTLTHAVCSLTVSDVTTGDLEFQEPIRITNSMKDHIETGAFGIGYFEHFFDERDLIPNNLYSASVLCYCLNDTASGEVCYFGDGGLGAKADFKECQSDFIFLTGEDLRPTSNSSMFLILVLIIVFTGLGFAFRLKPMVIFAGIMQFIFGLVWLTVVIEDIPKLYSDAIGMILCLTGLGLILSYVASRFDKKRKLADKQEQIIINVQDDD